MKKVALFFAFAVACVSGVFAQKQTGGEKNLEVNFAPLGGNPISTNGIRLRLFNSEATAIRIGLFIGGSSTSTIDQEADNDANALELIDVEKSFSFSIRPGFEKHFAGTDRLSPYIGGEILFGMENTTSEDQIQDDFTEDDNFSYTQITKGGSSTIGLNVVAGTDFYFADNIYLGAEIGFGFSRTKDKDNETTWVDAPDGYDDATSTVDNETMVAWGPNFQGTIRLGWLFN